MPAHVSESMASKPFREGLAVGKLQDAGREIVIRVVAAARDCLTDARQDLTEIETIKPSEEPATRLRKLQDRDLSAGLGHTHHLVQAQVRIGDVPQTKGDRRDLEMGVGEGQM